MVSISQTIFTWSRRGVEDPEVDQNQENGGQRNAKGRTLRRLIENQNMGYKPNEMVIYQTMQNMDIDYDEAAVSKIG